MFKNMLEIVEEILCSLNNLINTYPSYRWFIITLPLFRYQESSIKSCMMTHSEKIQIAQEVVRRPKTHLTSLFCRHNNANITSSIIVHTTWVLASSMCTVMPNFVPNHKMPAIGLQSLKKSTKSIRCWFVYQLTVIVSFKIHHIAWLPYGRPYGPPYGQQYGWLYGQMYGRQYMNDRKGSGQSGPNQAFEE